MRIIKIGKSHTNDIVIDSDSTVSRTHIEIFIDDERNVFVTDKNSLNGTFINGNKIYESKKLSRYDILRIGNTLINWRDYLEAEDNRVNDTKQDGIGNTSPISSYNEDDNESENIKKNKRRKNIYIWSLISVIILIIAAYFYFSQDSKKITTTWKSKDKSGLSYTFYEDGTFEKDSNDVVKSGTYKLKKGREQQIELHFDKESLPVYSSFYFNDNTNKFPFPKEVDYDRVFRDYYGNLFRIENTSDYEIKILSVSQQTIKSNESNVNSKLYISNRHYNILLKKSRDFDGYSYTLSEDWNLVSNVTDDIYESEMYHFDINDCIIEKGESISMMILTKDFVSISIGNPNIEDQNLSITESVSAETLDGLFYHYTDGVNNWNGTIEFGLMRSDYKLDYEFVGGNLELNGKLFKRK